MKLKLLLSLLLLSASAFAMQQPEETYYGQYFPHIKATYYIKVEGDPLLITPVLHQYGYIQSTFNPDSSLFPQKILINDRYFDAYVVYDNNRPRPFQRRALPQQTVSTPVPVKPSPITTPRKIKSTSEPRISCNNQYNVSQEMRTPTACDIDVFIKAQRENPGQDIWLSSFLMGSSSAQESIEQPQPTETYEQEEVVEEGIFSLPADQSDRADIHQMPNDDSQEAPNEEEVQSFAEGIQALQSLSGSPKPATSRGPKSTTRFLALVYYEQIVNWDDQVKPIKPVTKKYTISVTEQENNISGEKRKSSTTEKKSKKRHKKSRLTAQQKIDIESVRLTKPRKINPKIRYRV